MERTAEEIQERREARHGLVLEFRAKREELEAEYREKLRGVAPTKSGVFSSKVKVRF